MPFTHTLFIHSSWQQPSHFTLLTRMFTHVQIPNSTPLLPSTHTPLIANPFSADIAAIQAELDRLIVEGKKDVLVVGHGYGAAVMNSAVGAGYRKAQREARGETGGVVRVVYMAGYVLREGESVLDCYGGEVPWWIAVSSTGLITPLHPLKTLYNDLTHEPALQRRSLSYLRPFPLAAFEAKATDAAYLYHPSSYLYCDADAVLAVEQQRAMVRRAEEETGCEWIPTKLCNAAHCPMVGQPETVLELYWEIELGDEGDEVGVLF